MLKKHHEYFNVNITYTCCTASHVENMPVLCTVGS